MKTVLAALLSGILFGVGLAWSGMMDPARVLGFLDLAGDWDPTLMLVMAGAVAVTMPGFRHVLRGPGPWAGGGFRLPARSGIDAPLLFGAAIFGVGWGIAGLCPGPALAGLVTASPSVLLFVLAMAVGQWLATRFGRRG